MMKILFENARVFDGHSPEVKDGQQVLVADDIIQEISGKKIESTTDIRLDLQGRTLMPGLIDNHIHVHMPTLNTVELAKMLPTYYAHYAGVFLHSALMRGFTTIRDVGGGDIGIARAIDAGLIQSPRFFYAGKLLSQTGGHGDFRHSWEASAQENLCNCGSNSNHIARIVDGPQEIQHAVRDELRKGAHCIKIMASGGVASPSGDLYHSQFSMDEIRMAVSETARQETYVSAHCHPDVAVRRCIDAGVRCIEHATLIEADTANLVVDKGAFVVPTLAVIFALYEEGAKYGLLPASQEKIKFIYGRAVEGLSIMKSAGVKMGFGTDLLGEQHVRQCTEFAIRKEVLSPFEILHSATAVNAEILMKEGVLGIVKEGAMADLIVVDGDPLDDVSLLENNGESLPVIMRGGELVKCTLEGKQGLAKAFSWPAGV